MLVNSEISLAESTMNFTFQSLFFVYVCLLQYILHAEEVILIIHFAMLDWQHHIEDESFHSCQGTTVLVSDNRYRNQA